MCCAATAQLSHGNQLLLLSSLSLRVRLSSSAWLPALKKRTFVVSSQRSWASSRLARRRSLKTTLAPSRCLSMDTSRAAPSTCTFAGVSCATTSTLAFYASFRPRHATSSQISEPRLVLIFSSSSSVLYFAVVFDSIVASPRASSSRRLSLLGAKWLLAHQTRLVLSTLPVSSALHSCILELRGGI